MGDSIQNLVNEAQHTLMVSQGRLGELAGASQRTGQRWAVGRSTPSVNELRRIASLVYPRDRDLAARIAAATRSTLADLGLEAPPPPPPGPFIPPDDRVIDSVVCAVADELDLLPKAIRAALLVAFTRTRELGLSVEAAEAALRARLNASDKGKPTKGA